MIPPIEVERAVESVMPPLRSARWALSALLVLIAAAALGFVVWWIFIHPGQMAAQIGQGRVDASLGKATGDIATSAIPQITEAGRQKVDVDVRVQKGIIDVRQAPDAGVAVHGVSDALRRNVCLYDDLYNADPACQSVHEDPAGLRSAGSDAGRGDSADRR